MTTEITFRPGLAGLMAALSAAEHIAAASPVIPAHVRIDECSDWLVGIQRPIGVLLYFHEAEDAIQAFARHFEVDVSRRDQDSRDRYTYADCSLNGVPVRAWTLAGIETPAVAA